MEDTLKEVAEARRMEKTPKNEKTFESLLDSFIKLRRPDVIEGTATADPEGWE